MYNKRVVASVSCFVWCPFGHPQNMAHWNHMAFSYLTISRLAHTRRPYQNVSNGFDCGVGGFLVQMQGGCLFCSLFCICYHSFLVRVSSLSLYISPHGSIQQSTHKLHTFSAGRAGTQNIIVIHVVALRLLV